MGAKILIAEDEPFIVESLQFLLSRVGYDVRSVLDGGSVVPAIHDFRPDLLVLDVMLPTTNGFDVLRRIRSTSGIATLPVLILTAKGQDADRKRMVDLGANDFVAKPFSNTDLLERIGKLVPPGTSDDTGSH